MTLGVFTLAYAAGFDDICKAKQKAFE